MDFSYIDSVVEDLLNGGSAMTASDSASLQEKTGSRRDGEQPRAGGAVVVEEEDLGDDHDYYDGGSSGEMDRITNELDALVEQLLSTGGGGGSNSNSNSSHHHHVRVGNGESGGSYLRPPPPPSASASLLRSSQKQPTAKRPAASSTAAGRSGSQQSFDNYKYNNVSHHNSNEESDPLLRRFARWQERKEAKRLHAVYDALLREQEACPFTPNLQPIGLLEDANTSVHTDTRTRSSRLGSRSGNSVATDHHQHQQQQHADAAGWAALLEPSTLYADNRAWGEDEFISRMEQAREERDRPQREEEMRRARYLSDAYLRKGPTVPQPFDFVRSGGTASASASASPSSVPAKPQTQQQQQRQRFADIDTFAVMGPRIRKEQLFSRGMTDSLSEAASTVKKRFAPSGGYTDYCDQTPLEVRVPNGLFSEPASNVHAMTTEY